MPEQGAGFSSPFWAVISIPEQEGGCFVGCIHSRKGGRGLRFRAIHLDDRKLAKKSPGGQERKVNYRYVSVASGFMVVEQFLRVLSVCVVSEGGLARCGIPRGSEFGTQVVVVCASV